MLSCVAHWYFLSVENKAHKLCFVVFFLWTGTLCTKTNQVLFYSSGESNHLLKRNRNTNGAEEVSQG